MKVAASVCGGTDFWHTWRATGNALEGTASRRNDATLMLDEIREVDGREAGNIAYMLANGEAKPAPERMDRYVKQTAGIYCFCPQESCHWSSTPPMQGREPMPGLKFA